MSEIKDFFKSILNLITIIISVLLSLSLWLIQPQGQVSNVLFIITTILAAIFLWLFLMMLFKYLDLKQTSSIQQDNSYIKIIKFSKDICLCNENKLLSHGSIVSFYYDEEGIETLIAYGIVINIQSTGLTQIQPFSINNPITSPTSSIIEFISNNQTKIIVKPVITQTTIQYLKSQEGNQNV